MLKSFSTSECFVFKPGDNAPSVEINVCGRPVPGTFGFGLPILSQVRGWLGLLNEFSLSHGYGTFSWQRIKKIQWDVVLGAGRTILSDENSFTAFMQFDPLSDRITEVSFKSSKPYKVTVLPKQHWSLLTNTLNRVYGYKKVEIFGSYPTEVPNEFIVDTSEGDIKLFVTSYRKYMALVSDDSNVNEILIDEEKDPNAVSKIIIKSKRS